MVGAQLKVIWSVSNIMEDSEWLNCYWPLKRLEKDQDVSCFPFQPIVLPESSVGPNIPSVPEGTFWWMTLVIYLDNFSFLLGTFSPFFSKDISSRSPHLMGEDKWAEVDFQAAVVASKLRGWEGGTAPSITLEITLCSSAHPWDSREGWAPAFWLSDTNLSKC